MRCDQCSRRTRKYNNTEMKYGVTLRPPHTHLPSAVWLLWSLLVSSSKGGTVTECPVLTPPANGRVNYGVNAGDTAAYTCNEGYSLSGTNFRECQNDFTWTLSDPTCVIVDCSAPAEPTGGTATYTATTYESVLSYSCNTGYTLTAGATSATCGANGNWDNGPPTCTIDDCGPLTDPSDGSVSVPVTTYGAVATYTCVTGYDITAGSGTRTCQDGESWDGTEPTCSIQDCGSLTQPADGSVAVTTTTYSSTATFSCDTGYDLNGATTVTCQADGTWETVPTCDIKDCGNPTAPSDGDVTYTTTTYNSVATFTCDTGYNQTGASSATCLDTGVWSDRSPTCNIVNCGALDFPKYGFVNHDPGTVYLFVASYTCDTGYDLVGSNIRRCQADGTWSSTSPTCQLFDCGTPTAPTDGSVISDITTYESEAQYVCDTGYSLSGTATTTCGEGTWSGTVPSCTDNDECTAGTDNCDVNAACTNIPGSFTCSCNLGYSGDGVTCSDDNECTAGTDNCDVNAACTNTVGSFTCTCNSGYSGDGVTCTDDDECTAGTDNCDVNAACTNIPGSFTCSCNSGYSGDGITCSDDDECTAGTDNCDVNAACTNTVGSFTCTCNSGYSGDGVTCSDDDECTAGTDNCDVNAACNNIPGSFTCTCNLGYTGNGVTCTDDDECTAGTDNCDVNAACTNTVGSFTCTCNSGYSGDGVTCSDDNECTSGTDNCDVNAACTNNAGTFTCTCNPGYTGDGVTCSDDDECTAGTDNCDVNAACTNTVGSFTCTCNSGYSGDGVTCTDNDECTAGTDNCDVNAACTNIPGSFTCTCNPGYTGNGVTCSDVHECTAGTDNCDVNAACTNTVGSFTCTCNSGYSGDGVTCSDDEECTAGTDNCDVNAACTNIPGSFTCTCNSGYSGNGVTCTDDNECTAGTDNCDVNAACANTAGSFTCTCNSGYSGDGVTCSDDDECTAGTDNCDVNAACTNTVGSFTCTCNSGYSGNGVTCTDDDECTAGTDNCDVNAACTNTAGSFTCTCNLGYSGNGVTCSDDDECTSGTDNCDVNAACTNTVGSFTCTCNSGYSGDGVTCTDDDECTAGTDNCDVNAACTNIPGSFTCTCNLGYSGNGVTCSDDDECTAGTDNCDVNAACANTVGSFTCTCNSGYSGDGVTCTDDDECTAGTDNCDVNAACNNIPGSFTCTCNLGFSGNGVTCSDDDECTAGTDNCDVNAACANTAGSFTCTCNSGYSGNGVTCTDDDECTAGTDNCNVNAACTNTAGSFTCTCNSGYSGNGVTCTDDNECTAGTDNCDVNAACTNIAGSFTCTCNVGYSGDGVTCSDDDECTAGTDNCDVNAACTNTAGSFTCACNSGYSGNGVTCTDDDECTAGTDNCDVNAACTNIPGSFTCTCNIGYSGDGVTCEDCGALSTTIDNGIGTQTGTTYQDTTVYTCNEGYMISVGTVTLTVTCQADATWDNTVPTCIVTDCGSLASPNDGQVNTQPGTLYQQLASYTCNLGYNLIGSNVRECQANGLWDSTAPTCQIVDCLSLTNPGDGLVDTSSGTTFFEVATYTCDPGYEITAGTASRTCQLDGNWNGMEPTCSRKNCGSLSRIISDGSVTQSGTLYEDTTVYTCSTGYYISTSVVAVTVTCTASGTWDGSVPTCIPVDCGDLPAPSGGQIDYSDTSFGTRASYTCNVGHDLNGINVRTCGPDGNWDNAEPVCEIKDCGPLTDPVKGTVAATVTTYGETAVYTCDTGYRIDSGSASRNCMADGSWDGVEPVCAIYDCGSPGGGPFDTVSFTTTTYGSTAVYTCSTGYYHTAGDLTHTCGEGVWSGTAPTCTIRDCGNLGNPAGGSVSVTTTTYNEAARYTCGTGYYNSGGDTLRTCQADGTWSGAQLQCTIYDCLVPTSPVFGTVDYTTTTYGSLATYSCDTGYYTTDTVTSSCGDGTWNVSVPTCTIHDCGALSPTVVAGSVVISGSTYNEAAVYTCNTGYLITGTSSNTHILNCGSDGSWDDDVPTCTAVDCGGLADPEDGGVDTSSGTGYLDVAAYTCLRGYELIGSNIRTCQADGDWSDTAPICRIYDCGSPPSPTNGSVSAPVTTFSELAVYSCNIGHYISAGTPVRTCDHRGTWNGTLPTCSLYDCGPLLDQPNGAVSVTGVTYGETATYSCNTGYYRTAGDPVRTCGNGTWTGQEPTCTIRDCGLLLDSPNGKVSLSDGTTYLQVANYTCDTGYRVSGGNIQRTCGADGSWDGSELICIIYDCGVLLDIANGGVTLTGMTYRETASYTCDRGYYISSGDATRTCREGFWNGTEPVCTIYDCGSAGTLTNGHVDALRTQYRDTANYSCDAGYLINGTEVAVVSRECQGDGTWSGEQPVCVFIDCGVLRPPDSGTVDVSRGTGLGDTAAYTCTTGYDLVGINVRTCQPNGVWDGTEPSCAIRDCGQLRNPRNGGVVVTGTTFGETASYLCLIGYYISFGNATRTCRSSGVWDGTEPVCTQKVVTTPEPSTTPSPGDERDMVCGHRYEDLVYGITISSMTRASDFLEMKNLVKNAVRRSNIHSGNMRIGVFVFGQEINHVIHLNDFNTSSSLMEAVDDIPYSSTNGPSQLRVGLSQLLAMFDEMNGDRPAVPNYAFILLDDNVNVTGSLPVASQVRNDGIHLDMFAIGFADTSVLSDMVYQPNGHIIPQRSFDVLQLTIRYVLWKDSSCNCGILDSPSNGSVLLTGTFYMDVATYSCDEGFDLVGAELRTCQYGGPWSGSPPRCVPRGSGTTQAPFTTPDPDSPMCGYVNMDIIIALAVSSTVGQADYTHMMTLVRAIVDRSDIDGGNTQLGFFVFNTVVRQDTVINLRDFNTREGLSRVLRDTLAQTSTQSSRLSAALAQVLTMALSRRQNIPLLVYIVLDEDVILDGSSELADQMRDMGIVLSFASVGFSTGSIKDLMALAFAPSPAFVWDIPNFATIGLAASQFFFKDEACNCRSPERPFRGSVTVTGTYFLDEALFSCDAGYDLVGSQLLVCQYGGTWNGSSPSCSLGGTVATSPPPTIPPHLDTACGIHNLDIIYAVGVSNTMTEEGYLSLKYSVVNTIHRADIDFGLTRFGFFLFDAVVREDSVIHLKQYSSRADLILAIDSIDFQPASRSAQLSVGLSQINDMFSPLNGDRRGISNMAVVLLDGSVETGDSVVEADMLKNKEIALGFLTIGFNNITELEKLAHHPTAVFAVDSYSILRWAMAFLMYKGTECSCGELDSPASGSVVMTGYHFQDVAAFSCDEGFELVGSRQLICQEKQTWSSSPPTCFPTGTTSPPRQTVNPTTDCGLFSADVVVGIALSMETSEVQFLNMLSLVKTFIRRSSIDLALTQFGFFIFDAFVQGNSVVNLQDFDSSADLLEAIDRIQFTPFRSFTRLLTGLQQILRMFSSQTGSRVTVPDHAFIVTDTNVLYYDTFFWANQLVESGIMLHILTDKYDPILPSLAYPADGHFIELPSLDTTSSTVTDLFRNADCDCGILTAPDQGSVTYRDTYYLDTATYSCDQGFVLIGSRQIVCQDRGLWSGSQPVCFQPGTTPQPTQPPLIDITCGFRNVDLIMGLALSGSSRSSDFTHLKTFLKAVIDHVDIDGGSARFGSFVFDVNVRTDTIVNLNTFSSGREHLASVDGLQYSPTSVSRSVLTIGLQQLHDMFTSPGFGRRPEVPAYAFIVTDSNIVLNGSYTLADQIRAAGIVLSFITVDFNFVALQALLELAFARDRNYNMNVPSYLALSMIASMSLFTDNECDCGLLPSLQNGTVIYEETAVGMATFYLDVASFSCDEGFDLTGSQQIVCQYGGSWSGSPPTCLPRGITSSPATPSTTPSLPVFDTTCGLMNLDVVLGVAVSSTTTEIDFEIIKNFMKTGIDSSDVETGSTQIGFFVYGSGFAMDTVALDTYRTRYKLHATVDSIMFMQSTNKPSLFLGLEQARDTFSSISNRPGAPDMLYMIIDNDVDITGASDIAQQIKAAKIHLDFIAVGFSDLTELDALGHVLDFESYEDLQVAISGGQFYKNATCNCGELRRPENGTVLFEDTYYLDIARFSCNEGYELIGSQQLVCQYGGSWHGSPPTCSPKASLKSVDLVISLNMITPPNVDFTNNVTYRAYRDQVRLALVKHYGAVMKDNAVDIIINSLSLGSLLVDYTVVITNNETSAQEFTQSTVDLAQGATLEIFSEQLSVTSMNIGENTVNLVTSTAETLGCTTFLEANGPCDSGYVCQLEESAPKCVPDPDTDCGFPGSLVDGMVSTPGGTFYGTNATYACNIGYTIEGSNTRTCEPTGLWMPESPTCVLADCGNLTSPVNGMLDLLEGTTYGQTARFSCLPGYTLLGQRELVCREDSLWSDVQPACQIIDSFCGRLLDPQHGSVNTSDLSRINSRAVYTCNLGYQMSGPDTRICSESMSWEPQQETVCVIQDCEILRNPVNGNVDQSSGTTYGQTVIFSCSVGYQIFGAEQATCMADGNWSSVSPLCQITNCGGLPNPVNGLVSATQTTFGQVASYTCNLGYMLSGTSSRICQPNGSWSSREPDCLPRDCGPLSSPVNGFVNVSMGTTYNSGATYSCNEGYSLAGPLTTHCEYTGIWDPPVAPTCTVIDCGKLFDPDNGLISTTLSTFGQVATYTCNRGYSLMGTSSRICQSNGSWSSTEPDCLSKDCGPLSSPVNGFVNISMGTTYNSVATYSCNEGYSLIGPLTTRCEHTGIWDPPVAPTCTVIDCGTPPNILNGDRFYTDTTYGSFTNYICDAGYDQVGSGLVMCGTDALWDTVPACSKIDCGEIQTPTNGSVMFTNGTLLGSQAIFDCDPGFYMTGFHISDCSERGTWTTSPPFCILHNCGPLSEPADGSVSLSDGTVYGSTAQFSCNIGYKLSGPEHRTCSDTGDWEPQQTTRCSIQDCGSLQNPLNGNVDQSSGTTYGQTVIFSCSVGYDIFGADHSTCMENGDWSTVVPLCQVTDCGGLSSPTNGMVSASETTFGQVAVYICNEGYTLTGTSTRICQPAGSWSGSPPACQVKDCGPLPSPAFGTVEFNDTVFESVAIYKCDVGYRLEGFARRTCSADGRWSDTTPVCTVIDCGSLSSVQFETFRRPQRTTYGTEVTFSCNTGYQLIGNARVTCLETSQWSDLPSCVIVDCGELSRPENGMLALPGGTTYGQAAQFSCQTGYLPSGPTELLCEADGSWSASPPICQLADCGILPDPVNGGVTVSGTKYGDYATYVCDAGHQITGSSSRLCQEDGKWSSFQPSCTVRDCGLLTAPLGGNVSMPSGTTYGNLAKFVCNQGYDLMGLSTLVCRADGTWSSVSPTCLLKQGLLSKDLTIRLNMTVPEGLSFSDSVTYNAYLEEVRIGLTKHYGTEMKDDFVEIYVNSLQLGSLMVEYTVILKDNDEAVKKFTQASSSLVQGSTVEVFNQKLGVNRMTVDNSQVDLVGLSAEERACKLFLDLAGPCQAGYVCTLVGQSPDYCGIPARPGNGAVDYSRGTLYGDTVIYTCDTGFALIGHNTRTCQGDGNWAPAEPTCSITECRKLTDPVNGQVIFGGTVHGQTAFYTCNPGYSLIGAAVITCKLDGNWNYLPPTCRITGCGGLTSPIYGSVTISADGQRAQYSCQTGFILTGDGLRICSASNIWSGSEPVCNAIECVNLPDPVNGRVDLSGTSYGSTATYHCTKVGYILSGTGTRVCGQDGQWSASAPSCDIIECDVLPSLSNGIVEMSGVTYGQTAAFSCNQGFVLQGAQTLTCMAFGWSGSPPTCQSMGDCGSLDNPVYGYVTFTVGTAFLSKATYSCYMGYQLSGSAERVCQADNSWSGTPATCSLVDCGLPSIPDGGRVDYTSGTTYGRVGTYTCNSGHDLIGPATITCQNDGAWSFTPVCRARDCGSLPHPVNGLVDTVAGTLYGSVAIYTCNPGYYLQGGYARTCLATGSWDTFIPSCVVKDCGPLSTPTNGVVNVPSGTTYGQTASYSCNSGYVLTGPATRQCTEDGSWTGAPPVCVAVVCGSLSTPVYGRVTLSNGLVVGSVATYTCNPGYLRSPLTDTGRTCQVDGTWTGAPPLCILIDCGGLSEPVFGELVVAQTTYGYTATFSCNQGYMLTGSTERTCAADGYWTGTQPVCTVTECESLSNPDNGKVKMPEGTRFGDTAVYKCNAGYAVKNGYKRTCQSNGTWSGAVPYCESSREFALAVGLGVGLTGFVILVLVITLIVVILYRRGRSKHFGNRIHRKYTVTRPMSVPPPVPMKINTRPPMLVPFYTGPAIIDDETDISERPQTWRSRKADYGDPTNPLYYNVNMPRDEYYSYYRN